MDLISQVVLIDGKAKEATGYSGYKCILCFVVS